jgi:HK97 family phage major capsid protein
MNETEKLMRSAIEEREELVARAESLVDGSDGTMNEDTHKEYENLIGEIKDKDRYIDAKKWQLSKQAENTVEVNNSGERKEMQKFSWSKFLMSAHPTLQKNLGKEKGFYDELDLQGRREAKQANVDLQGSGSILPLQAMKASGFRGDLTVGTEGEDVVFEQDGGFIDKLNEAMVLTNLGADFLTGLSGDTRWPREANAPTGTWEGETDANAEHTPTFDKVSMSPKRVGTFVDVSNQAILQTNPSVDARVQRQLVSAIQRAIELAAINGSGTAPIPEGILNTTGIGSADIGTNGGVQTWPAWVANETNVAAENADIGSLGYLTNTKVRGQAKTTIVDAGSGQFLWPVNATEVNGYPVGITNLVPSNLTKGTGTGLSALIFGNFNDLIIGQWGGLEVLVDPFTQATAGITRMVINVYADVAVLRPTSFSATQDIDA